MPTSEEFSDVLTAIEAYRVALSPMPVDMTSTDGYGFISQEALDESLERAIESGEIPDDERLLFLASTEMIDQRTSQLEVKIIHPKSGQWISSTVPISHGTGNDGPRHSCAAMSLMRRHLILVMLGLVITGKYDESTKVKKATPKPTGTRQVPQFPNAEEIIDLPPDVPVIDVSKE